MTGPATRNVSGAQQAHSCGRPLEEVTPFIVV